MPSKTPIFKKKKTPSKITKSRPNTTLFLVMSVDGRITSHDSDDIDPNKTWKRDPRVAALTQPFVDFGTGEIHTLTYGETMSKVGINTRTGKPQRLTVKLIVIDDQQDITSQGVAYLAQNCQTLYFVCLTNHPLINLKIKPDNLQILSYAKSISLKRLMQDLNSRYQITRVNLQSHARFNARWLSSGLVDQLSVIVSPLLVGRFGTPNLIDQDLLSVKRMTLTEVKRFGLGFVNLRYDVLND